MARRRLSPEEERLWRRATRDVARRPHALSNEHRTSEGAAAPDTLSKTLRESASAASVLPRQAPPILAKNAAEPRAAFAQKYFDTAIGAGDPRADKRVARRRQPIERTLDLHGLTQVQAETRLTAFLLDARRDGCRCVLVITGKGGLAGDGDYSGRGVLHRRLSHWINAPAIRPIIARTAPAHQKDGGDGAWYVFLKKR
ncbi:MAG: Smr/MutS family protein [Pseudomonadota bacterium]